MCGFIISKVTYYDLIGRVGDYNKSGWNSFRLMLLDPLDPFLMRFGIFMNLAKLKIKGLHVIPYRQQIQFFTTDRYVPHSP